MSILLDQKLSLHDDSETDQALVAGEVSRGGYAKRGMVYSRIAKDV